MAYEFICIFMKEVNTIDNNLEVEEIGRVFRQNVPKSTCVSFSLDKMDI